MSSLRGAEDLAKYIGKNYTGRVVEVGAGHVSEVAVQLLNLGLDVVVTDKEERYVGKIHIAKDDIFKPDIDLYLGASLVYSIRPPLELQLAMGDLASLLDIDILIRPLQDEIAELSGFDRRLVNVGEARFYIFAPNS
jgi:uncharacterized UPF0146 family protein